MRVRHYVSLLAVLCCAEFIYGESIAGVRGGSYVVTLAGDQISSLLNSDGSTVEYRYDTSGNESGLTVSVDGTAFDVQYSILEGQGQFVQAGSLPPLLCTYDEYGRAASITLYPGMSFQNGEWYLAINAGDPINAATFGYGPAGHLASIALSSGLSLELGQPDTAGVVQQAVYGSDGSLLASASSGGASAVRILPAQLDAVASQFGLGADWAEMLSFTSNASGHLTTARGANGEAVLYLVDAGPFRVAFSPGGEALFYVVVPSYAQGEGIESDAATEMSGVVPTHIVVTSAGATGMYNEQPARGALYGSWVDSIGSAHVAKLDEVTSATRTPATQSVRVGTNGYRFIRTTVCADGVCWTRVSIEWVDEDPAPSGGGPSGGGSPPVPPARGGASPGKTGNQVAIATLRAAVDRALPRSKEKLKNQQCLALLDRTGIAGKKLIDVMRERGYDNPGAYLTTYLTYFAGGSRDCPGTAQATTKVNSSRVAICPSFSNASTGMASVYLIHEMMHTLGYGEAPMTGWPPSLKITQDVIAACGNN